MFKKLMTFLFEEEGEEVYADDELEDVVLSEEPVVKEKKVRKEARQTQPAEHIRVESEPVKKASQPKPKNVVMEPAKDEVRHFTSINIDEAPATPSRTRRKTESINKENKSDFEFSPVISPIFGTKEDAEKPTSKVTTKVPATGLGKPKKNLLGTIISPMYGANELEEFEQDAKEKIEVTKKIENEEIALDDTMPYEEEEMLNVPLEDLLRKDEDADDDDTMQISLFGEDEPIKEEVSDSTYKIKE